jgi:hypothetical protein
MAKPSGAKNFMTLGVINIVFICIDGLEFNSVCASVGSNINQVFTSSGVTLMVNADFGDYNYWFSWPYGMLTEGYGR